MAIICRQCGTQMYDGTVNCPNCGTLVEGAPPQQQQYGAPPQQQQYGAPPQQQQQYGAPPQQQQQYGAQPQQPQYGAPPPQQYGQPQYGQQQYPPPKKGLPKNILMIIIIAVVAVVVVLILVNVLGDSDNGRGADSDPIVIGTTEDDPVDEDDGDVSTGGTSGGGGVSPGQSSVPWPSDWPMYPDGEIGPGSEIVGGDNLQIVIEIINTSKDSWLKYLEIVLADEQWSEWGIVEHTDTRTDTMWAVGFPAFYMEATLQPDGTTVIITESYYPEG